MIRNFKVTFLLSLLLQDKVRFYFQFGTFNFVYFLSNNYQRINTCTYISIKIGHLYNISKPDESK